jgi:hypothetical protein
MTGQRKSVGKGFSEQEFVEYRVTNFKDAVPAELVSRADFIGMLRRVASRRHFGQTLNELERTFAPLLPKDKNVRLNVDEHGSESHYADRISTLIRAIRGEIAEGKADQAARWAFKLGQLVREYGLKGQFEPAALTGEKSRKRLDEGRDRKNQKTRSVTAPRNAQWQALAQDIRKDSRKDSPELNDSEVARRIIKRLRISDRQFRNVRRVISEKVGQSG